MTTVKPLEPADRTPLGAFFTGIPEGDRTFFRDRVLDDGTIDRWLVEPYARRLLAVDEGAILGVASLVGGVAWSAHVGSLEIVVDPEHRRQGIGRLLVQESIRQGVPNGIEKFVVSALADQQPTLSMLQSLGFEAEAILRDHVRDDKGQPRDLVLLAHFVQENEAGFDATGIIEAVQR